MPTRRDFLHSASLVLLGLATPSLLYAQTAGSGEKMHIVRKGENLTLISRRYAVPLATLRSRNKLRTDVIRVGQKLIVPGAAKPAIPASLNGVIATTKGLNIARGRWKYVVTHHSGIEDGNARSYHSGHLRRGMEFGLAYHFVIGNGRDSGEGQIEIGPRWLKQIHGGHVRSETHNEHGIGICLVGNFQERRPSTKQLASFTALVDWLRTDAPLGVRPQFTVHRWVDRNHTVCPGRHFPFTEMRKRYGA